MGLRWALCGLCWIGLTGAAPADPKATLPRYIRDRWGPEQGYDGGPVYAFAQTPDGYLWIGTERGLIRFDGYSFRLVSDPMFATVMPGRVLGLATDKSGDMWIRLRGPNLLQYRDGAFRSFHSDFEVPEGGITAMGPGRGGAILLSAFSNGILKMDGGRLQKLLPTSDLPNFVVLAITETSDGTVWIGTRDSGLFSLSAGRMTPIGGRSLDRKINCLLEAENGTLWIGTDEGLARWNGTAVTREGIPAALNHVQVLALARDHESNMWIATAQGLLRADGRDASLVQAVEGGTGDAATAVFEDREGNLWTSSGGGIERLRQRVFFTYSPAEGMPSYSNGPIFPDRDGRLWFAAAEGGLYSLRDGQTQRVDAAGLSNDVIYSIAGDKGELWVGRQAGGLTHLRSEGNSFRAESYTQKDGLAQNSVYSVHRSRDGTVWAGTLSGGVSKFSGGRFTNYTIANGLTSNTIASMIEGADGTMWFATPKGLSALSKGRWESFAVRDGLPSENVNCLLEDSGGIIWIGTVGGLALLDSGQVKVPPSIPQILKEQILGIAEDRSAALWIATSSHVLRVNREKLILGQLADGDLREYAISDGLQGTQGVKRHRSVVTDSIGRIWFSMNRGLSVVDPGRLTRNSAPAIVRVQAIVADGNAIDTQGAVRVPAGSQRITVQYAGLSLAVPERMRFRFMLQGYDHRWSEPTSAREATYTNLGPATYRFRIMASNPDGVWNSAETGITLTIAPFLWQTWWFKLAIAVLVLSTILAFYQFRLRRVSKQLSLRFEERLGERTRIAQELHDTLLQGFLSASMQLHVAADRLPEDSPVKQSLSRVLQLMGQVIEEGRNALRGLRATQTGARDLGQAFSMIGEELNTGRVAFRVIVEGASRTLHPMLRDEIYRIGREALVNAFRHSGGSRIELELEYGARRFRLLVRDNGSGIDPKVLQSGRDGHWGLPGMRERAERIGGQFHVWSSATSGTDVELSLPGRIAFQSQASNGRLAGLARRVAGLKPTKPSSGVRDE